MNTAPRVIYSGHTANWPILILSIVLTVPLFGLALANGSMSLPDILLVVFVSGALLSSLFMTSSLRSAIGPSGATVRFGMFGLPRFHWPIEKIEAAEAVEISHWDQMFGIWWAPAHGWKLALRSGPAVRLTLSSGRHVTFNVEDSAEAIAALEAARHQ